MTRIQQILRRPPGSMSRRRLLLRIQHPSLPLASLSSAPSADLQRVSSSSLSSPCTPKSSWQSPVPVWFSTNVFPQNHQLQQHYPCQSCSRCFSTSNSTSKSEITTTSSPPGIPNSIQKLQLSRTHQDWKDLALYFSHQLPDPQQESSSWMGGLPGLSSSSSSSLLSMDLLHEWIDTIEYWIQSAATTRTTVNPSSSAPSTSSLLASRECIHLASNALRRLAHDLHAYPQSMVEELLLGATATSRDENDGSDKDSLDEEDDDFYYDGVGNDGRGAAAGQQRHTHPMLLKRLLNQILTASKLMVIDNHPPSHNDVTNHDRQREEARIFQSINRQTPMEMFELVQECCRLGVAVYPHAFQRIMETAFCAAQNEPSLRRDTPIFCENILKFMLTAESDDTSTTSTNTDDEQRDTSTSSSSTGTKLLIPDMPGDRVPRLKHFTLIMKKWAHSGRNDRVERGIRILNAMEALLESGMIPSDHRPDVVLYNTLLELLRSGNVDDFRQAERVFAEMDQGVYEGVVPDMVTYRIMFFGFAESIKPNDPNPDAADRAIFFLRKMEVAEQQSLAGQFTQKEGGDAKQSATATPQLDASMYAFLIMRLTHAGFFEKAEQVLSSLLDPLGEHYFHSNHPQVRKALIFLYSKTNRPDLAQEHMLDLERDWSNAKFSQESNNEDLGQDERAPKRSHYEAVLEAWVASRNFERIQSWLDHLALLAQAKDTAHLLPRRVCVTQLLESYAKTPHDADQLFRMFVKLEEEVHGVERIVSRASYDRMIQMWGEFGDPAQAQDYLNELCAIYERTGDAHLRPGASHFTAAIQAWARSNPKTPSEREESSRRMFEVWDSVYTPYSQGKGVCVPDSHLYNSIINACARTKNMVRMEQIASFMIQDFLKGNKKARPKPFILTTMLLGVVKSKRPNFALGNHLVQLMAEAGIKPDAKAEQLLDELKGFRNC